MIARTGIATGRNPAQSSPVKRPPAAVSRQESPSTIRARTSTTSAASGSASQAISLNAASTAPVTTASTPSRGPSRIRPTVRAAAAATSRTSAAVRK